MSTKHLSVIIFLIGCCAAVFPAYSGTIQAEEDTGSMVLRSIDVHSIIDNGYAVTEILYGYENTGENTREASFGVTIPDNAFISNFSLSLGNTTYFADVLTKDEAREHYDDAVASGKTAGLAEQRNTKLFTFAVNVESGQLARATLRYEHYLNRYLGERIFPLYFSSMTAEPETFELRVNINSDAGITRHSYDNYESQITESWDSSHVLTINMNSDALPPLHDFAITYEEAIQPVNGSFIGYYDTANEEYYFLNSFSPMKGDIGDGFSKDIVFVLDKSGSMGGENKIEQLKESFLEILDQLPEEDRFGIIMFDSDYDLFKPELVQATRSHKEEAREYLRSQGSGGGTKLLEGLEKSLNLLSVTESRAPIVVMLTDGKASRSPVMIRERIAEVNTNFVPIFTLGFGTDVDFDFLTALSLENHAKSQQIFIGEDASEQIVDFYETISSTLLRNIEIDYSGGAYDYFPEMIPALYEGSENIVVGKLYLNDIGDEDGDTFTTTFRAETPEGTKEFNASYPVSTSDTDHDAVKRFWSYARIFQLMDELTLVSGDEREILITEIENLSIEAHFVTPYTSLYLEVSEDDSSQGSEDDGEEEEEEGDSGGSSGTKQSSHSPYNSPQISGGDSLGVPSGGSGAAPASNADKASGGINNSSFPLAAYFGLMMIIVLGLFFIVRFWKRKIDLRKVLNGGMTGSTAREGNPGREP